jgi:inner membrane protein
MRRGLAAAACLAGILGADHVIRARNPRWLLSGLLDEPAHLATGALVLLNLRAPPPAFTAGFLAGCLLPDLDHVPLALRAEHPSLDTPRPRTHCLATLAALAPAAAIDRDAAAGAAAGCLAHFARDVATGPGAPLLWPLTDRPVRLPYAAYAAAMAALTAAAARRTRQALP